MRNICFLCFLYLIPLTVSAQYITPGNHLTLSFEDLVAMSDGAVLQDGDIFLVNSDLIISATDKLVISEESYIRVAAGKRIEILGQFISDPNYGTVTFTAQDTLSVANNFRGFRFDNAEPSLFRNTTVKYSGGIQLLGTFVEFNQCVIRNNGTSNTSSAITFSNTSPIIRHCDFIENLQSAIGSAANVQGSPIIQHNRFIHNVTNNTNRPQINLGPGVPSDTLRIENNYIEGNFSLSGGIAVATLTGGTIVASIRNNTITNNRYGYTQVGNNISSIIEGNQFIDNNLETNPLSGGSGINFFGSNTTNVSIVRNNLITGNLWGITIQGNAQPSFGTEQSPGGNVIFQNGNSGETYALYNNTPQSIQAVGNYWGDNSEAFAESVIFHKPDDSSLGTVTYLPIKTLNPVFNSFGFLATDNTFLNEDILGEIDEDNATISISVPGDIQSLRPFADIDLGIEVSPALSQAYDFSDPIEFALSVPHENEPRVWTIQVTQVRNVWLQFVHKSADPELEFIDVYVDGNLFLESFEFRMATEMMHISGGSNLIIEVTKAGDSEVIASKDVTSNGSLVFHGVLEPDQFLPNPEGFNTNVSLSFFMHEIPLVEWVPIVNIFHAATDLPKIAFVNPNFNNGNSFFHTSYSITNDMFTFLGPEEDFFYLETRDQDTHEVIARFKLIFDDLPDVFVLYVSGFQNPGDNQNGAPLNVFAIDFDGNILELLNVTHTETNPELPLSFLLRQNYPNPFNPTTVISFDLPEASHVRLSIYTITGQLLRVLKNESLNSGTHTISFDATALSSGMYLYHLQAGEHTQTKKMLLVR